MRTAGWLLPLAVLLVACSDESDPASAVESGGTGGSPGSEMVGGGALASMGGESTGGSAGEASDAGADAGLVVPPVIVDPVDAPPAPEFPDGLPWLNTNEPYTIEGLRGQVVMLDVWTFGCINCLHQMPVFRALEDRYANEAFVVLGCHTAKFDSEKDADAISLAMQHYDVRHPVIVDNDATVSRAYGANAWPTVFLIDAEGRVRRKVTGEFTEEGIAPRISELIEEAKLTGVAGEPIEYLVNPNADATSPLLFPTKVTGLPDGRVVVTDSSHHRLVVASDTGDLLDIIGTGSAGYTEGSFDEAQFERPQGTALLRDLLYVADTENHVVREIDLDARTVRTVAGTGFRGASRIPLVGPWHVATDIDWRSPWDLEPFENGLVVAHAGTHQLLFLVPGANLVRTLAGTGHEALTDGAFDEAAFAQPSGLSLSPDGTTVYVADSESSSVRAVTLPDGDTTTLVGQGLFTAGDRDGVGDEVRLQHAVGVETLEDGTLVVADTYNSKLKQLDPGTREVTTLDWPPTDLLADEPRGLSRLGDVVYVADTNHHRILRHDLATGTTDVFDINGLTPP